MNVPVAESKTSWCGTLGDLGWGSLGAGSFGTTFLAGLGGAGVGFGVGGGGGGGNGF